MVSVNIRDFPEELHHKAKIRAAVEKITLKELVIKALTEYLEREGVK
jgi:predicted HicB family RNase H-like nuclease